MSIQHLLSGVPEPVAANDRLARAIEDATDPVFAEQVERIREDGIRFASRSTTTTSVFTRAESYLQVMLKSLDGAAEFGPRLFTVNVHGPSLTAPSYVPIVSCRVSLWCEYSRRPLWTLSDDPSLGVYEIDLPSELLAKAAPWLNAMATVLRVALPMAIDGVSPSVEDQPWSAIEAQAHYTRRSRIDASRLHEVETATADAPDSLLRDFHALLRERDPSFGGLVRVRNRGRYLWVHPRLEAGLNPGLPEMGDG